MAAPMMDYIQYINNLPICDTTTREILNEYIETLNGIIGSEHEHDVYMKQETMEGLYFTKKEFDTIDFSEKINLSNHVSKEELNSFNYLTASYDGFCTLTNANKKLNDLKSYITDVLKKYALKSDLDLIKDFLNRLEIRIKTLEDDNDRIIEEIEILKSIVYYSVQYEIDENITNTNNITVIEKGKTYSTVLTSDANYILGVVQVSMNNVDITAQCVSKTNTKAMINIENVSGPIIIRAQTIILRTVTKNIGNCAITNPNDRVAHGSRYYAQIAANLDYVIVNATLTMGGQNVSNMYMSNTEVGGLRIDIPNVTGDIVITVKTEEVLPAEEYQISYYLVGGVASDDRQTIYHGESFYTEITVTESTLAVVDYQLTMDGIDVTTQYMSASSKKATVNIPSVTGHINIRVEARKQSAGNVLCTLITCNRTMTLQVGQDANLNVYIEPTNTTDSLYWDVSDPSALSIYQSSGGYWVHAVKAGTYDITLYCGYQTAGCHVTIIEPIVYCESVSANDLSIPVGSSKNISYSVYPYNCESTELVSVTINNTSIARKSGTSSIQGVAAGTTTATLTLRGKESGRTFTDTFNITVSEIKCTNITCSPTSLSVTAGSGGTRIAVTTTPSNTTDPVTAYSSNTSIATVYQGSNGSWYIQPAIQFSGGAATITFECNNHIATCTVTGNIVKCTGLSITSSSSATIYKEGTVQTYAVCTFSVSPSGCTDTVTATSSNTSVATVTYDPNRYTREAQIYPVGAGTATITIRCGSYSVNYYVTVVSGRYPG